MLDREQYINSPSPIEQELNYFFGNRQSLVIFDIGSCEGEDSVRYSKLFPSATVYAVEPLPNNLKLLKQNIKKYEVESNVNIIPLALSDRQGYSQFYVSSGHPDNISEDIDWDFGNKSSSLLYPTEHKEVYSWVKFNEVIEVETDTLVNVCKQKNISEIDFIHLDVQGAELQVFRGSGDLLKSTKLIWMEVEAIPLYENQPLKADIESFMQEQGFVLIKSTVGNIAGDQLYVNSKYFKEQSFFKMFVERLALPSELNTIIFSKDRACQLELLLRSIKIFWKDWHTYNPCILYTFSDSEYYDGYERVKLLHPEFTFICEKDYERVTFKQHVLNLIRDVNPYTVFFVDDDVFCQPLDLEDEKFQIFKQRKEILCLSLRLSPEISYSYVSNISSPHPEFKQDLMWNWREVEDGSDWGFAMSLDGHIFRTSEIKPLIIESADFSNPNFLEERMVTSAIDLPEMICFSERKIVNIPANKVQTSHFNRYGKLTDQIDLNREFLEGRNIIFKDILDAKVLSVHQEIPLRLKNYYSREPLSHTIISVIVVCCNQSYSLPHCIEGLLEQTFDDFQVIIVNAGSTDNTQTLSEQLINTYPKYISSLVNCKDSFCDVSSALVKGINAASGKHRLFIVADQVAEPNMLLECYNYFQSCYGNALLINFFEEMNKKQIVLSVTNSKIISKLRQSEKQLQEDLRERDKLIFQDQLNEAKLKSHINKLQNEVLELRNNIAAMESSKFWMLRSIWSAIKKFVKAKIKIVIK